MCFTKGIYFAKRWLISMIKYQRHTRDMNVCYKISFSGLGR